MLSTHRLSSPAFLMSPPTTEECKLSRDYLKLILGHTIMSCIYGTDVAVERALRVSLCAWSAITESARPESFYELIRSMFPPLSNLSAYQGSGVPSGAIPLFLPAGTLEAPVYHASDLYLSAFYIVDVFASDHTRFIPSPLFIPYQPRSSLRCRDILEWVNPIPLWFFGEGGILGVPIKGANGIKLVHGLEDSIGEPITTLKIKFGWPNYKPDEKQIRGSTKLPLNNLSRLASLTANAVCEYMSSKTKKVKLNNSVPQRWAIGTGAGEISSADVVLLGVVFVSTRAVMPLLAVRDEFIFATDTI
ncbi:hypothetical protein PENSPDRAFT_657500 [Peniophora sp. CONT]|nr:hypothetical protein PENSPDRAFT_657500 [Peniophora sp. CONT]